MPVASTKIIFLSSFVFVFCCVLFFACGSSKSKDDNNLINTAQLASPDSAVLQIPSVKNRIAIIQSVLETGTPVIALASLGQNEQLAQNVFINNPALKQLFIDASGSKMLNEIFAVYKALPSDLAQNPNCTTCYRAEMYNYALNNTYVGIVDITTRQIISTSMLEASAPDVPEHLKKIAVDIAIQSSLVKKELGDAPELKDAQMAYTKTALNNSKCQRSLHLCVAPTFVKGSKALWSIVDLTDLKLVGTRWTNVGDPGPVQISERTVQNDKISSCYCLKENEVNQNGWQFKYMLTSSDGMRIANVKFNGKSILKDAKLVDWHVSYSNSDGFGYSDGIGCPEFSLSAVTAWDEPKMSDLMQNGNKAGFVLEQVFKSQGWPGACNYNYVQRFEFYNDGKFRVSAASIGRGCGNDGTYRPVFRIAFEGNNSFSAFENGNYKPWQTEQWALQKENTVYSHEGFAFKINGVNNFGIEPGRGQFGDKGRGDNAYTYVTKFKSSEGESDLVTIGPCCNTDYKQGPEKFIEPNAEAINNTEIVLWYVPQMKNDNTKGSEYCWAEAKIINGKYTTISYPCFAGPMFVPIK
jgi:hypothetical protein